MSSTVLSSIPLLRTSFSLASSYVSSGVESIPLVSRVERGGAATQQARAYLGQLQEADKQGLGLLVIQGAAAEVFDECQQDDPERGERHVHRVR